MYPSVPKKTLSRRDSAVGFSQPKNSNSSVEDSYGGNGCQDSSKPTHHFLHRPSHNINESLGSTTSVAA